MSSFAPNRTAALEQLQAFLPRARDYAARRNYDLGAGNHTAVSTLSPYIRHRMITEEEVLQSVLGRYSLRSVEKFVQEVYWRTYWKGWLDLRPGVWTAYRAGLEQALDRLHTQSGLRQGWEAACKGETGNDAFDHWTHELTKTGYLHNHARMWFASIWIFTLRLPWELGADFFLRHLLDGDPASNTLSWRWVAGLQTQGKNYVARTDNIATYTEGRFAPSGLAVNPMPLDGPPPPPVRPLPAPVPLDPTVPTVLLLHEEDMSPGFALDQTQPPRATAVLRARSTLSPLHMAPQVLAFRNQALTDTVSRWQDRLGPVTWIEDAAELNRWAQAHPGTQIATPYAPVGPVADLLHSLANLPIRQQRRDYDSQAWPHATAGFFKFKAQIPSLAGRIKGLTLV